MEKKKQNQKQPIEQEDFNRYKDVFDNIEESYVELDLAGNTVFFNDSLCKALGYSAEELMGMNFKKYVSPENIETVIIDGKVVLDGRRMTTVDEGGTMRAVSGIAERLSRQTSE